MKYVVFWEFNPDDWDKIIEILPEYAKDTEENPGKYHEYLLAGHLFAGQTKGFSVVEATPEQISNVFLVFKSVLRIKFIPIVELSKVIEQYSENK